MVTFDEADDRFAEHEVPAEVARGVPKRRSEFLAGRFCALEAIRALEPSYIGGTLPVGRHRAPIWPTGLCGSITHADGVAMAAASRLTDAIGIGIDTAPVIDPPVAREIASHIARPHELKALEHTLGLADHVIVTLVFAAKEAVFKCLFSTVGHYFGHHEVEIVDASERAFWARLDLAPALPAGTVLEGYIEIAPQRVNAGIVLPP